MDPDAALAQLRTAAGDWAAAELRGQEAVAAEAARAAIQVAAALDEWLSAGGFLPADWQTGRDSSTRKQSSSS